MIIDHLARLDDFKPPLTYTYSQSVCDKKPLNTVNALIDEACRERLC
jgi:hypothetical protein